MSDSETPELGRRRPRGWARLKHAAMDATVLYSFDAAGFERHAAHFVPGALDVELSGRRGVVTGANSGLGFATTAALAQRGMRVQMVCRNLERGREALEALRSQGIPADRLELSLLDLADLPAVARWAEVRASQGPLDVLVHNAGLLPDALQLTPEGLELTAAVHLCAPHALTRGLLPALRASGDARVVTVSSGGMYTARLNVGRLRAPAPAERYDGVKAYAHTKRGQVALSAQWQRTWGTERLRFHCMHPGWADTPGVAQSLPTFYERLRARLRTPEQGADTAIWLAAAEAVSEAAGGQLWFDRRPVSEYALPFTREPAGEREALWAWVEGVAEGSRATAPAKSNSR